MKFHSFDIPGPVLIEPKRQYDIRGYVCETYNAAAMAKTGIETHFRHDTQLLSTAQGTVKGLRFQRPPLAQAIVLRVVRGGIQAVAADIRAGSPSYGRTVSAELSAENGHQLYIPVGFAHGFATLRPLTEIAIKASAPMSVEHEQGIFWDDPALRIKWLTAADDAVLSPIDEALPLLRDVATPFQFSPAESVAA